MAASVNEQCGISGGTPAMLTVSLPSAHLAAENVTANLDDRPVYRVERLERCSNDGGRIGRRQRLGARDYRPAKKAE
jgi:hypothetical protein